MRRNISKARIFKDENGNTKYERPCKRCRKFFVSDKPQRVYCSDACKEAYNKAKKSKSKSGKRYARKHNVSRAVESAARNLSRRLMMLIFKPIDAVTGEEFNSWDFIQCHHLDLCCLNTDPTNLVPLTPQQHDQLHKELKEKFGKDIEDRLYQFGRRSVNFGSEAEFQEYLDLKREVVNFQRSKFKLEFNQVKPKFDAGE
jgi:hypothetical protein